MSPSSVSAAWGALRRRLWRAGVGAITLVDHDTVAHEPQPTAGRPALDAGYAENRRDGSAIRDIHPDCRVTGGFPSSMRPRPGKISFPSALTTLPTASTPRAANWTSSRRPSRAAFRSSAQWEPETGSTPRNSRITDLSKTSGCPLAKVMRRELRRAGSSTTRSLPAKRLPLTPRKFPGQGIGKAHAAGLCVVGPPCAGMMIAGYIVQQLLAQKSPEHPPV